MYVCECMFVKPGQQSYYKQKTKTVDDERWNCVWEVSADLDGYRKPFPIPTVKKPDIVIWYMENKTVQLAELTVSNEDNIEMAKDRKDERYAQPLDQFEEVQNTFLLK